MFEQARCHAAAAAALQQARAPRGCDQDVWPAEAKVFERNLIILIATYSYAFRQNINIVVDDALKV
jgi:hypothetical protein